MKSRRDNLELCHSALRVTRSVDPPEFESETLSANQKPIAVESGALISTGRNKV